MDKSQFCILVGVRNWRALEASLVGKVNLLPLYISNSGAGVVAKALPIARKSSFRLSLPPKFLAYVVLQTFLEQHPSINHVD